MNIVVTRDLKETVPFFEFLTEGETIPLNDDVVEAIYRPRPKNFDKLQRYIVNRVYLGFDVLEDAKWLMWVGSVDPSQLFTPDLQVRKDLHPIVINMLNLVKRDELVSRMGPWRCEDAAAIGNLYLLRHLRGEGYSWNVESCFAAAENGHLEVLKYLIKSNCPWNQKLGCSLSNLIYELAVKNGHLDVLKYLFEIKRPLNFTHDLIYVAIDNGHLEILKYLLENNFTTHYNKLYVAIIRGHLEIVKYLHENDYPWDERACFFAVENGHFELLKYLHKNGCPWDEDVCSAATKFGHLEILKYLRENGCPMDRRTKTRRYR